MKKILIPVVVLVMAASAVFVYMKSRGDEVRFKTERIAAGPLRATVTATGIMNAVTTVLVGTQVSGTLKKLYVDYNSRVRKGQVIAEIDPATFEAQVDQARANLLAAKANVQKAKATLVDSARIRDRNRQLFSRNLIARSDLDTSESNRDANDAQVSASAAQVAQSEAALRFAETNLKYTKIVSPVDGTVVSRNVDVGQTVAASFQTPTLFTIAQDLTKMQIDTSVDEADIGRIKTGQHAEFTVDAFPDSTFHGTVEQIRIAPITVQNVVTYDVVIKVDNTDMRLKPGMTANVSVIVASREAVLKIPNAALRFRPTEKDGVNPRPTTERTSGGPPGKTIREGTAGQLAGPPSAVRRISGPRPYAVWILDKGQPKRIAITLGISDGAFTEVASGDLREGHEVIVESLAKTQKNGSGGPVQPGPRFMR